MAGSTDKIFVGGLPKNCSDEAFSSYFEQFGNITDVVVMKDRETGESRGFGFVTYDSTDTVDKVIAQAADHKIHDKWVDVKRATPKGSSPAPGSKGKGSPKGYSGSSGKDYSGGMPCGKGYGGYGGAYGDYGAGMGMGVYGASAYGPYGGYGGYGGAYGGYMAPHYPAYAPHYGGYGAYKGASKGGCKGYSPY